MLQYLSRQTGHHSMTKIYSTDGKCKWTDNHEFFAWQVYLFRCLPHEQSVSDVEANSHINFKHSRYFHLSIRIRLCPITLLSLPHFLSLFPSPFSFLSISPPFFSSTYFLLSPFFPSFSSVLLSHFSLFLLFLSFLFFCSLLSSSSPYFFHLFSFLPIFPYLPPSIILSLSDYFFLFPFSYSSSFTLFSPLPLAHSLPLFSFFPIISFSHLLFLLLFSFVQLAVEYIDYTSAGE